jgi:transcription-repair coupling factor (superfamily II helicase)
MPAAEARSSLRTSDFGVSVLLPLSATVISATHCKLPVEEIDHRMMSFFQGEADVFRGGTRAFAYLLTESASPQSEKRLSVIEEFSRPGEFAISEQDLDHRGAGEFFFRRNNRVTCRYSDRYSTVIF